METEGVFAKVLRVVCANGGIKDGFSLLFALF